jgi:hypothetical protein
MPSSRPTAIAAVAFSTLCRPGMSIENSPAPATVKRDVIAWHDTPVIGKSAVGENP